MVPPPKPGDRVRITEGTFEGFIGVVLEPESQDAPLIGTDPANAVLLSLNIFNREVPLRFDPTTLAPA